MRTNARVQTIVSSLSHESFIPISPPSCPCPSSPPLFPPYPVSLQLLSVQLLPYIQIASVTHHAHAIYYNVLDPPRECAPDLPLHHQIVLFLSLSSLLLSDMSSSFLMICYIRGILFNSPIGVSHRNRSRKEHI